MRLSLLSFLIAALPALGAETPVAAITPAKVPPLLKPPKGSPPEVLAVLSQRGDRIDCLATTPDGRLVAFGGPDAIVRVWDLEKLKQVATQKQPNPTTCLSFDPEGKGLAVGDSNGNLRMLKFAGGSLSVTTSVAAHKDSVMTGVVISPDNDRVYTAAKDKQAIIWNWAGGKLTKFQTLTGHGGPVRSLSLTAGGGLLATVGDGDETVRVWETAAEKPGVLATLKQPGRVVSVAFAPDGKSMAVGGAKGVPAVWTRDKKKWDRGGDLDTGNRAATGLDFSPDGKLIVGMAAHSDTEDRVVIWNKEGSIVHEFRYELHLHAVSFIGDAGHLLAITEAEVLLVRLPK
jgi:WD40 repeat protein